jgi:hypothetical protein
MVKDEEPDDRIERPVGMLLDVGDVACHRTDGFRRGRGEALEKHWREVVRGNVEPPLEQREGELPQARANFEHCISGRELTTGDGFLDVAPDVGRVDDREAQTFHLVEILALQRVMRFPRRRVHHGFVAARQSSTAFFLDGRGARPQPHSGRHRRQGARPRHTV